MAANSEEPVEVSPGEDSGSTVTVDEVSRDMAAVSAVARKTSNKLNVTRTSHHVQVLTQSRAQVAVEAEVADAMCVDVWLPQPQPRGETSSRVPSL